MFALLDVTFPLKFDIQYTLSPSRWHLFRIHDAVEQFTYHIYSKVAHKFPRLSWYFVCCYTAFPHFIPLSGWTALSASSSLMFRVIDCLVSFFCFNSVVFLIHQHVKVLSPSLLAFVTIHQILRYEVRSGQFSSLFFAPYIYSLTPKNNNSRPNLSHY